MQKCDVGLSSLCCSPFLELQTTDRFNNLLVTSYVSPGSSARFLLLHDGRNDDSIKSFFSEVYELYVRIMLNPFHGPATKISNK